MTHLAAALNTVTPREKSGATTGSRFAFQAHVSLAKMLDLHEGDTDFRAVFDHYDDLTILTDSSPAPTEAAFFQIKGKKSGSWTAVQLAKAEGQAPQTIVGKMYHHTVGFGSSVACAFVSNAPFSLTLSDGKKATADHVSIAFNALHADDQNVLQKALDLDFKPPRSPDEAGILRFERTPVPLTDYDVFLRGRLVVAVGDDIGLSVNGLYRLLIDEINHRANDTTECTTTDDVFRLKSLCRADLQNAISAAQSRRSILDHWTIIDEELSAALRTTRDRIALHTHAISYIQARAKRDAAATALSGAAREAASHSVAALNATTSVLAAAEVLGKAIALPPSTPLGDQALEAAMLVEAFEAVHG